MDLLTKKEFADLCGMPQKNLYTYINRDQIIVNNDGMIDENSPINELFILERKEKMLISGKTQPKRQRITTKGTSDSNNSVEDLTLIEVARQKKRAELRKLQFETRIKEVQLTRAMSELIPLELAKSATDNLFRSAALNLNQMLDHTMIDLISIMPDNKELFQKVSESKNQSSKRLNLMIDKSIHDGEESLQNISEGSRNVRKQGERNI